MKMIPSNLILTSAFSTAILTAPVAFASIHSPAPAGSAAHASVARTMAGVDSEGDKKGDKKEKSADGAKGKDKAKDKNAPPPAPAGGW